MTSTKNRLVSAAGGFSGASSVLSSWQICHNICLGTIALLGSIGITLTGMPFMFLTKIAFPLWIIALILLSGITYLYLKHKCISKIWLIINYGLVIAGIPFMQSYKTAFLIIGGLVVAGGIVSYVLQIKAKKTKRCCYNDKR